MNIPDKKTDLEDNRNARSFLKTRIQAESAGFFNGLLDTNKYLLTVWYLKYIMRCFKISLSFHGNRN